jgi:hypothetical protein
MSNSERKEMSKVSNCTHYWLIDSNNVGHCKYCPAVKDFGELLMKQGVFVAAGRRGAKARKEVLGKKRGRKKKEVLV